ncbi:MAG: aconitate hydratase 1 [Pseudomonadota bacterium]|jgi:aconitate hydratase
MMQPAWLRETASKKRWCDVGAALQAQGRSIDDYPFCVRVMLENVLRSRALHGAERVPDDEIQRLIDWHQHLGRDVALAVSRVVLPDSSGLPLLQDLAALRDALARRGLDPSAVDTLLPVDLIVDHSLQVDHWARPDAIDLNLAREFKRNEERYRFIKWAHQAFQGVRIHPPGSGIIHQIHIERIAEAVTERDHEGSPWWYPEFVLGCDSHTTMINALGVLGWGVGGLDAEAALLGQPYGFPIPEVVGVRLSGTIGRGVVSTDLALLLTERLRSEGVTACALEFFGPAADGLPVAERATLANMCPEYGASCGFFPVDARTLDYLRATGRSADHVARVETYCRAARLFRTPSSAVPRYSRLIDIDVSKACPSLAGPRRPQDRLAIGAVAADFQTRLTAPVEAGGYARPAPSAGTAMQEGAVVLAAITSCTNTANPTAMLTAGLVARRAHQLGLRPPPWVKTSMTPGSRVVGDYLRDAGVLADLEAIGFGIVGHGCTTCGGKSGPLNPGVAEAIEAEGWVTAAVISGNRNFEGRIHKLIRANYIGAPHWVVMFALAGRIDIDLDHEPLGHAKDGQPVYAHDLLPDPSAVQALRPLAERPERFRTIYQQGADRTLWSSLDAPSGARYVWDAQSSYLVEPPFFERSAQAPSIEPEPTIPATTAWTESLGDQILARPLTRRPDPDRIDAARVLVLLDDSVTTDHISPGGEIPLESAAGRYLSTLGVRPSEFNSYVGRRGNYRVMTRAGFANLRLRNQLVPGIEGGHTRQRPEGPVISIFEAAMRNRAAGTPSIVLAGRDYGSGSSRDWAAKCTVLLGIVAVIAESFERIHRANLIAMGVLPLSFEPGDSWRSLGLTGDEHFTIQGISTAIDRGDPVRVHAVSGTTERVFAARPALLTGAERDLMRGGGIPSKVLDLYGVGRASPTRRARAR